MAFLYLRIYCGFVHCPLPNSWLSHCCQVGVAVGMASAIATRTVAGMSGVGVGSGVGLGNSVWRTARILLSASRSLLTRASTVESMSGVAVGGSGVAVGGGAEQAAMADSIDSRAITRIASFIICLCVTRQLEMRRSHDENTAE